MSVLIVDAGLMFPETYETLKNDFGAVRLPHDEPERSQYLGEYGKDVTIVVSAAGVPVPGELIEKLPHLEAIVNFAVGYDNIDIEAAKKRGIEVSNTPDVLNDAVADMAVGLMIDVMRGITASDRYVREGKWPTEGSFPLQREVTGARVGILGLGRIGHAISARLAGFRCEIGYHNRNRIEDATQTYFAHLKDLAQWADVLVVATPGGASTASLVDAEVLAALGEGGYLVNIARGTVVDEDALVAALQNKTIAGAGLDVFAHEPNVPEALFSLDNVVLSPHAASATVETRRAMGEVVIENVRSWMKTHTLVTRVV